MALSYGLPGNLVKKQDPVVLKIQDHIWYNARRPVSMETRSELPH